MKLLLDTHIWPWALAEPAKLSGRVKRELENSGNEIWVSSVSTWEALMLHAKNRIQLPGNLQAWFARATSYSREAPLTHEIAFLAHQLPLPHTDRADRFLAATAKVLSLVLVTQDPELLGLGDIQTVANR